MPPCPGTVDQPPGHVKTADAPRPCNGSTPLPPAPGGHDPHGPDPLAIVLIVPGLVGLSAGGSARRHGPRGRP